MALFLLSSSPFILANFYFCFKPYDGFFSRKPYLSLGYLRRTLPPGAHSTLCTNVSITVPSIVRYNYLLTCLSSHL